ncbi:MAG: polyamine aminopropyltransferase [Candidatus Melainabacteria bacterium]|nr:polyamine aminopropyltransferase [Candidatus Melainabacteria bacterium]
MFTNGWFFEDDLPPSVAFKVKEYLYTEKSKYQKIDVFESVSMGKVMLLDNRVMVTEKDEFYYHENIVHPVMSMHPNPKKIMIIGGGDGGTVREVLKYKTVEEIELIEIDEEVINVSKKFFPHVSCELDNPKLKIIAVDAIEYIKNATQSFYDVIICDCTDPDPGSIAAGLISKEFYANISKALQQDGIFISQNGCPIIQEKNFEAALNNARSVFKNTDLITSITPSYPGGYLFTFLIGANSPINRKIKNKPIGQTKFWDEEVHLSMFIHPKWLKEKYLSLQSANK